MAGDRGLGGGPSDVSAFSPLYLERKMGAKDGPQASLWTRITRAAMKMCRAGSALRLSDSEHAGPG